MDEVRKFENNDIIEAIKILDYMRINLARIGRLDIKNDSDLEKFLLIENLFIEESDFYKKLTHIWRLLIDNYTEKENDELDEELGVAEKWDIPHGLNSEELKIALKSKLNAYEGGM